MGDGSRLEAGGACCVCLEGSNPSPPAASSCSADNLVSVVYAVGTSACEAESMGSTPIGHPCQTPCLTGTFSLPLSMTLYAPLI